MRWSSRAQWSIRSQGYWSTIVDHTYEDVLEELHLTSINEIATTGEGHVLQRTDGGCGSCLACTSLLIFCFLF